MYNINNRYAKIVYLRNGGAFGRIRREITGGRREVKGVFDVKSRDVKDDEGRHTYAIERCVAMGLGRLHAADRSYLSRYLKPG
ncbi:MAG: hypothetical protein A4E73_00159 [Syntrophaceae bacterium PtaU1.Bin231]|jgi:hypothetical protein|nr:MAG: hypothetical protein A4E73_00159 [Syntrophaceae bacterium PtaU1.Bin231]